MMWWDRQTRRRPILTDWNRRHGAIFVHIPKTAGTTLLDALGAEPVFDTHAPAITYRKSDPALFARAFKFTIVRNPWDRFASSFQFMKNGTNWPMQREWAARYIGDLDFAAFVRKLRSPWFRNIVLSERFFWPQGFWITDRRAAPLVDQFYRFEELSTALADIGQRLGIVVPETIPRRRKSNRPDSTLLYSDPEMVDLVARLYAGDIARFGYCFEPGE